MLQALYDYFRNLITASGGGLYSFLSTSSISVWGYQFSGQNYLAFLCALISLSFIFVLCCLFIYRLIRLVGRLFSGGAL